MTTTDHPTPFDPAAFLSECARVHEAAERAQAALAGSDPLAPATHTLLLALNAADEHRRVTYGALLAVAREVVRWRDDTRRLVQGAIHDNEEIDAARHRMEVFDRALSRLAAAGGGR